MLHTCLLSYYFRDQSSWGANVADWIQALIEGLLWSSTVSTVADNLEREIMVISPPRIKEISEVQKNYTAVWGKIIGGCQNLIMESKLLRIMVKVGTWLGRYRVRETWLGQWRMSRSWRWKKHFRMVCDGVEVGWEWLRIGTKPPSYISDREWVYSRFPWAVWNTVGFSVWNSQDFPQG